MLDIQKKPFFITLLFTTISIANFSIPVDAKSYIKLTESSRGSLQEIGGIKIGMTITEASRSSGVQIVKIPSGGEPYCLYYKPKTKPTGISFMVTNGVISRIDINNKKIKTLSGVKIGDTEARVKEVYGKKIRVEPHTYIEKGHYLIFEPSDRQDKNYRLLFETDGNKVINWRFGKAEEVGYVEGCV